MAISAPTFEVNNAFKATLLGNVQLALEQGKFTTMDTLNTTALTTPIAAQSYVTQFAIYDFANTGSIRDFEVSVSITETTGNTAPAPAPAFTITD